jgi:hypothetical protein
MENLLPPGLHIFNGDLLHSVDNPSSEIYQRFHASTHLCLFDLMFSAISIQRFAAVLSVPAVSGITKWRVMVSMHSPFSWIKAGLKGWSTLGKMSGMMFKGGVQSATIYFYTSDNIVQTTTATTIITPPPPNIIPSSIVQRQLQLQQQKQEQNTLIKR